MGRQGAVSKEEHFWGKAGRLVWPDTGVLMEAGGPRKAGRGRVGGRTARWRPRGFLCRDGAPLQVSLLRKEVIVQAMFAEAVPGVVPGFGLPRIGRPLKIPGHILTGL